MQSINGKDRGGKPFLYLSLALSTNSVSCFFIPGWQAQFCSNHFDSLAYKYFVLAFRFFLRLATLVSTDSVILYGRSSKGRPNFSSLGGIAET